MKIHQNSLIISGIECIKLIIIEIIQLNIFRVRCTNLLSFVLSDGAYYEGAKANFERAERFSVVRTTTMYRTNIISSLSFYNELRFN